MTIARRGPFQSMRWRRRPRRGERRPRPLGVPTGNRTRDTLSARLSPRERRGKLLGRRGNSRTSVHPFCVAGSLHLSALQAALPQVLRFRLLGGALSWHQGSQPNLASVQAVQRSHDRHGQRSWRVRWMAQPGGLLAQGMWRPRRISLASGQVGFAQPVVPTWIMTLMPAVIAEEGVVATSGVGVPGQEAAPEARGGIVVAEVVVTILGAHKESREERRADGYQVLRLVTPAGLCP
jgi:hypothetical protein